MLPPHSVIHNPHLTYRPDIDGLRALAIIAVVIFHAFPSWLPGGFVGVDVFFVISGYLITSIILKAQSGDGFSLLEFYSRRIKRIFPALIVVLIFCLVIGWFVLLADEYKALGKHVVAGAAYISNIALISESGYFDLAAELKPLLHLWSLGIEEQFYLLWPLLLIFAMRGNINPLALIILSLSASLTLNVINIEKYPTQVFFLPISRAWELLIGSILAYLNLYKRYDFDRIVSRIILRDPRQGSNDLANIFAGLGLLLILLAMALLNKGQAFPGWWALLPTIGAVSLIAAGEQAWFNRRILASKFAVYIGLISYPLYLWHWPLLSFVRIVEGGTPNVPIRAAAVALSVLLAWATYWLVERQLRFRQHWIVTTGLLAVLAMLGLAGYLVSQNGYIERHPQQERVARNVGSSTWNRLWNHQDACVEKFGKVFEQYCMINDISRSPTVLLIGDSNANHFYPGLAKYYARNSENLLNLGRGGCPPFLGVDVKIKGDNFHCGDVQDKAIEIAVKTTSIKTVVLSMSSYVTNVRAGGGDEPNPALLSYAKNPAMTEPLEILEESMRSTLQRLTHAGKQIIVIISIPTIGFDPAMCVDLRPWRLTMTYFKALCADSRREIEKYSGGYRNMVLRVLQDYPKVKLWDATHELCDKNNCWAMMDGVLLYRDTLHLNEAGSIIMGEHLPLQDAQNNSDQHRDLAR